jgi:hypothetical protein
MAAGDDADEEPPTVLGVEDVVDRPGVDALRHRRCGDTGQLVLHHVLGDGEEAVLEEPDADLPALAGRGALEEGGEDADDAERAAHDIGHRRADTQRPLARAGHIGKSAHHLHHLVERRAMLVGTGEEALMRGDDQPRKLALQRHRVETDLGDGVVAEILDEGVSRGEQLQHGVTAL